MLELFVSGKIELLPELSMRDMALCKTGGILSTSFTLTTVVRSTPKTVKSLIKSL